MAYEEFQSAAHATYQMLDELATTSTFNHKTYSNIILSSTEPGFTDIHDPNVLVDSEYATSYWPGGKLGHGYEFETAALIGPMSSSRQAREAATIRNAILGASVGKAALARVPIEMRRGWEIISDSVAPEEPVRMVANRCAAFWLPLAVCQTSRVVRSRKAPVNARMMHLWYPIELSPEPVLDTLRKVVRNIVDREQSGTDSDAS